MAEIDSVRVWDDENNEITGTIDPWSTWNKVLDNKGFPTGLVKFLETATDSEGCGFQVPTVVQAFAWPILQGGQDLVGVAKTGSGKTLAFLLPGFIKLRKLKKKEEIDTAKGPALVVLTPTRELCQQIYSDAEKFGKPVQITAACAFGGAKKADQQWAIEQGPDCLIATPGRLEDFCSNDVVNLDQCRFAVLDEADRMLDMGFEPQIRQIMDRMSSERQTALFTATWPPKCKKLAEYYIKSPVSIQIGSGDITTNKDITQHIEIVGGKDDKKPALVKILGNVAANANCLIFCNTKKMCRDLCWELNEDRDLGLETVELHGDLDQSARDEAITKFRSGDARVMVATDVASRGLDMRKVSVVVNYDAPKDTESYVHRIGRTGRAGDKGDAYTLVLEWGEEKEAKIIAGIIEKAGQSVPESLQTMSDKAGDEEEETHGWGNKEDTWDKKENDSWDKKEDASWDKKEDDSWNKKEDDSWNKKEDDSWSKKEDDSWKKKEDDSWKKKDDSWKKKDDSWGKKEDSWDKEDDWKKDSGSKDDGWGKKDDGWGKKEDSWDSKKEDSWGSKKEDSWGSKKEDSWDSKKEDAWGSKKEDSWGGKKDDSWAKKDDSWNKKDDGWAKSSSSDDWSKKDDSRWGEKEDKWSKGSTDKWSKSDDKKWEADAEEEERDDILEDPFKLLNSGKREGDFDEDEAPPSKWARTDDNDDAEMDDGADDNGRIDDNNEDWDNSGDNNKTWESWDNRDDHQEDNAADEDDDSEEMVDVEDMVSTGRGTQLSLGKLRSWLRERGCETDGAKADLILRAQEELASQG